MSPGGSLLTRASGLLGRETGVNRARVIFAVRWATIVRVAAHVSSWIPFLTEAVSMRGNWRVVGDGAGIALHSWDTLAGRVPLVGQPTELGHGLHDPGPLLRRRLLAICQLPRDSW